MQSHKVKIKVKESDHRDVNLFPHMLIFLEKLPEARFTNGHFINIYPTDLPFVDFDMPVTAYDESREKVPLVNKHGAMTINTKAKYLYFHLKSTYQWYRDCPIPKQFEFIKEFEFKV